jgi:AcrR family transcriptional regulator
MTETTRPPRPKAEARRAQILDAATRCARMSGFHGASMAEIAQAAGVSVGQIYRHFENKEAIIAAIVAQDIAEMREKFFEIESSGKPLAEAMIASCSESIARSYDPDRAALWLEVMAEAARNPAVAEILRRADDEERSFKLEILQKVNPPNCSAPELRGRGEVLSMIFEGMIVRGVRNPGGDPEAIGEALRMVLRHLLTEAPCAPPKAA